MNKFIHPRNIYKNHPNFTELASKYPDFREITKLDIAGKTTIDFSDEKALPTLTKCLLMEDFGLDVHFPANHLVPTLTLRLNYILWIEDIMSTFGLSGCRGIDIGCGASCIYPLLCSRKNNWTMVGLEIDEESIKSANLNISNNKLEEKIKIIEQTTENELFNEIFIKNPEEEFDFCMCNPPFFDEPTSDKREQNRTGKRPPPRNAKTGSNVEMMCEGGEFAFIKRIINESLLHKSKIKVYTTMVGIKNDVTKLVKELRNENITNFIVTEFCQGRTTRWGLAWTFDDNLLLRTVPCIHSPVQKDPTIFIIPEQDESKSLEKLKLLETKIEEFFKEIKIELLKINESTDEITWRMGAVSASWTNSRKRRREHLNPKPDELSKPDAEENESKTHKKVLTVDITLSTIPSGHTIQVNYLDGKLGKDGEHQILQYLVNKFNNFFK